MRRSGVFIPSAGCGGFAWYFFFPSLSQEERLGGSPAPPQPRAACAAAEPGGGGGGMRGAVRALPRVKQSPLQSPFLGSEVDLIIINKIMNPEQHISPPK